MCSRWIGPAWLDESLAACRTAARTTKYRALAFERRHLVVAIRQRSSHRARTHAPNGKRTTNWLSPPTLASSPFVRYEIAPTDRARHRTRLYGPSMALCALGGSGLRGGGREKHHRDVAHQPRSCPRSRDRQRAEAGARVGLRRGPARRAFNRGTCRADFICARLSLFCARLPPYRCPYASRTRGRPLRRLLPLCATVSRIAVRLHALDRHYDARHLPSPLGRHRGPRSPTRECGQGSALSTRHPNARAARAALDRSDVARVDRARTATATGGHTHAHARHDRLLGRPVPRRKCRGSCQGSRTAPLRARAAFARLRIDHRTQGDSRAHRSPSADGGAPDAGRRR